MYLQIGCSRGRKYLSIVQGYRDPLTKKVRHKTVKSLGYLDELTKHYSDPVAYFREVVKDMNRKAALEREPVTLDIDPQETLTEGSTNRKNIGYAALCKLYYELGLDIFFYNNSGSFKSRSSHPHPRKKPMRRKTAILKTCNSPWTTSTAA